MAIALVLAALARSGVIVKSFGWIRACLAGDAWDFQALAVVKRFDHRRSGERLDVFLLLQLGQSARRTRWQWHRRSLRCEHRRGGGSGTDLIAGGFELLAFASSSAIAARSSLDVTAAASSLRTAGLESGESECSAMTTTNIAAAIATPTTITRVRVSRAPPPRGW